MGEGEGRGGGGDGGVGVKWERGRGGVGVKWGRRGVGRDEVRGGEVGEGRGWGGVEAYIALLDNPDSTTAQIAQTEQIAQQHR